MRHTRNVLLLASALALGCGEETPAPEANVYLVQPTGVIHLQGGIVRFEIGGAADRIELLQDGVAIAEIVRPALWYEWNAGTAPEGSHVFVVRGWMGDSHRDSPPATVVVDRTPPAVTEAGPVVNHRAGWPMWLLASEPLIVEPGDVVVTRDGGIPVDVAVKTWPHVSTATAQPLLPIEAPSIVTLRVDGATDLAGNPLPPAERTFEFPVWWSLRVSTSQAAGLREPPEPSISAADGWFAFAWGHHLEYCRLPETFCLYDTAYSGPMSLAAGTEQLIAASLFSDGFGPVSVQTWTKTGLEKLADYYGGGVRMDDLRVGARSISGSGHDALATWTTPDGLVHAARLTDGVWKNLWIVAGHSELPAWSGGAALGADGTPWAAVTRARDALDPLATDVRLLRWAGGIWFLAGAPRGSQAGDPSLAVDADGKVYVAYVEGPGGGDVVVERWDGATWMSLGTVEPNAAERASSPSLALDPDGAPVVAYVSHAAGEEAQARAWVRRWNGSAWETVGTALNLADPVRAARAPALAVNGAGDVYVTFYEWTGDGDLVADPSNATWDLRVVKLNR